MQSFTHFTPRETVVMYQRQPAASPPVVSIPSERSATLTDVTRAFGYTLSIITLAMFFVMIWPLVSIEAKYRLQKSNSTPVVSEVSTQAQSFPTSPPEDPAFGIVIPKINVNTNVVADVNPAIKSEYMAALQTGVAHAKGTLKPGQRGTSFIFGHSTDGDPLNIASLNAQFYLLKELVAGDEVNVFFEGKRHTYRVSQTHIVDPTDVSLLQPQTEKEKLVLQTCWPPGTTLKRLLVVAEPISQ